jgi:hypothetical protein
MRLWYIITYICIPAVLRVDVLASAASANDPFYVKFELEGGIGDYLKGIPDGSLPLHLKYSKALQVSLALR